MPSIQIMDRAAVVAPKPTLTAAALDIIDKAFGLNFAFACDPCDICAEVKLYLTVRHCWLVLVAAGRHTWVLDTVDMKALRPIDDVTYSAALAVYIESKGLDFGEISQRVRECVTPADDEAFISIGLTFVDLVARVEGDVAHVDFAYPDKVVH